MVAVVPPTPPLLTAVDPPTPPLLTAVDPPTPPLLTTMAPPTLLLLTTAALPTQPLTLAPLRMGIDLEALLIALLRIPLVHRMGATRGLYTEPNL